ncbi:MAG TPA: UDP-N-acetylmuramate--L-alanine ligase [Candidatus Krumholzibacteria bacterium]|nr:UDP-N-acetylmuramate--L-alanine ligase [Candidatus Krumholzibacteria bacterium]
MVFLGRTKRVHFVGVGGIGMSGIAEVLLNLGFEVSGSDMRASDLTARLQGLGAAVWTGHEGLHVRGADVVVYSSAVTRDNPELVEARRLDIPTIPRGEMLAELMRLKYALTVAGAHGKTSTTSLIASVLAQGGLDPTVIVGGKVRALSSNARLGGSRYVVAEADESDGQFVNLPSSVAVITNIDLEHLDFYPSMVAIEDAFVEYANRVPFYGAVVLCADDARVMEIAPRIRRRKVTYSLGGEADIAGRIIERGAGWTRFAIRNGRSDLGDIRLPIPGDHYARNALAAVAVGLWLDIPFDHVRSGLESWQGVGRRFEVKGEAGGVIVVDDYGHHPTEIAATIQAAVSSYGRRVFVLFQPHRYSRTQAVADQFAGCFDGAHRVFITDIYPAGEAPIAGVDADTIISRVRKHGAVSVEYASSFDAMVRSVCDEVHDGDLVLTMGAGDIYKVGDMLLAALAPASDGKG